VAKKRQRVAVLRTFPRGCLDVNGTVWQRQIRPVLGSMRRPWMEEEQEQEQGWTSSEGVRKTRERDEGRGPLCRTRASHGGRRGSNMAWLRRSRFGVASGSKTSSAPSGARSPKMGH